MKRIVSLLLSLVMVAGMIPQRVVATENPCSHTHDDSCYTVKCAHVHGECSYVEGDPEIPCDHDCTQDAACAGKVLSCTHVHDDSCSYTEAEGNQDPEDMATPDEEIGSGTPDGTPPVLNGLTISATEVTIPGEIEVIVEASDDVSGVKYVEVRFFCESTDKYLYCHAEEVDSDGKFHATLKLDQYVESGTFVVDRVDLEDEAENFILYNRTNPERPLPESVKNLSFQVVEGESPDGTPPVLNGINLSVDTVTAPGEIDVIVDASDDVSGVKYVEVRFFCESTDKYLYCHAEEVDSDGKFHATLKLDQYVESGTFVVDRVDLEDEAENFILYNRTNPERPLPESVKNLSFQVVEGESPDGTPPILNGINLSVDTVTAPGEIDVIVDASDDVSGVKYVEVRFSCESTKKDLYCHTYEADSDGKFHATLELDQYVESGTFGIWRVDLEDNAGNYIIYNSTNPERPLPESVKQIMLNVFNTVPDVTTSVSKSDFVDVVKSATDNAYIAADYSGDATMPKEAFDAIAGTDKTIDLISAGITWRFEGSDITEEIKDIDLKVDIQKVEDDSSASGDAIENELNGNPGVVMKFPENGTLPGKATIQVKVDYAMRQYLGSGEGLSVYYYNNQTGELELIASDLKVINDTYVEFPITHCSYYVLTVTGNTSGGGSGNSCGKNLIWDYDKTTGTLTISGTGKMDDYGIGGMPWSAYLNEIQRVVIEEGVTYVGSYAFYEASKLTQVSIPLSVTEMEDQAFSDCPVETVFYAGAPSQWDAITRNNSGPWSAIVRCAKPGKDLTYQFDKESRTLTISGTGAMDGFDNVTIVPWEAYQDMIESVVVEEGVTSLGGGAFSEHSVLKTIQVPATVTDIHLGAFYECNSLQSVTVAADNSTYLSENGILFNKGKTVLLKYPAEKTGVVYSIPNTVSEIATSAFANCSKLGNVRFPNGLKTIGNWAFQNCSGLTSITIPDSVTQIGATAFASCTGLRQVTIGSGLTDLDICVFENCTSLEDVTLPDTLVNIWENTFAYCTSLKRIVLPSGMNFISDGAFHDCTALEEIVIGGVKEIWWPFENCTTLKKVVFQSDAPDYCTNAFQTLTLTAYYPAGNATWTASKQAEFGGNVTWIAMAYSGICGDNLTWTYSGGTLTISGTGAMYDYSEDQTNPAPWNHLAGDITKVIIEEGATSIGDYAFYSCELPHDVFIPQSLTTIGDYGLRGRLYIDQTVRQWYTVEMGAHDAYFPGWDGGANFRNDAPIVASGISGDRVFWELNENGTMEFFGTGDMYEFWATACPYYELPIKNVVIGEGITNIGMNIFEVMETDLPAQTLESVTIASTVTRVEEMAFAHCKALKTITFVGDAPSFGDYCFWNVTATAYYPAGNATWTAAVMQNYDGNITWVPYCLEHSFGDWITEGTNSHRTCIHCGYTEHKVVTDSGDVEIEIPDQPELDVEVDPVLPSEDNYVLVEEALDSTGNQNQAILKVFDINLKNSDGVHVQPSGTVKVKLPLDWSKNGNYKVYRVNDDGTLTDMNAYRQGSHMVFETDHFSLYVIVEEGHSHNYQSVVTAPTCTEDGFTTYTCAGCGHSYVDDEVSSPGHSYGDGVITTKPTCMTDGVKTFTCGTCGNPKTEPVAKDPKNHSFTKYESDKNATCKKNGTKTAKCDYGCGKTDTVTDKGSKLGHKYVDGKCTRCGVSQWIPDTGDTIMIAVATLVVSGAALLLLFAWKKKKLKR